MSVEESGQSPMHLGGAATSVEQGGGLLQYESRPEIGRRAQWVYVIAGIYGLIIFGLAIVPAYPLLTHDRELMMPTAITVTLLLACEAGLILVPVRVATRRPVTKRSLWIPIIASGLFAGFVIFGGAIALGEYFDESMSTRTSWMAIGIGVGVWLIWSVVFALIARSRAPADVGGKLHRWLIAGSVLELLVAVPTHLVVRRRTECCAGMATLGGICIGVVVMVLGFGPSVVFL